MMPNMKLLKNICPQCLSATPVFLCNFYQLDVSFYLPFLQATSKMMEGCNFCQLDATSRMMEVCNFCQLDATQPKRNRHKRLLMKIKAVNKPPEEKTQTTRKKCKEAVDLVS